MKEFSTDEMALVQGGLNCDNVNSRGTATVAFICGIGSFAGLAGALIFGPTSIALGAATMYCAEN